MVDDAMDDDPFADTARPTRLLVMVADPGDAAARIDAAVARWTGAGTVAHLVCGTSGELSSDDPAADPLEVGATAERQQRAAATTAGYDGVTFLHRPQGALVNDLALREQLVHLLRSFRPDALATFDPRALVDADGRLVPADQREMGQAALDAIVPAAAPMAFADQLRAEGLGTHAPSRVLLFGGEELDVRLPG